MLDTAQNICSTESVLFYLCCRQDGLNKRAGSLPSPLPHTGWLEVSKWSKKTLKLCRGFLFKKKKERCDGDFLTRREDT